MCYTLFGNISVLSSSQSMSYPQNAQVKIYLNSETYSQTRKQITDFGNIEAVSTIKQQVFNRRLLATAVVDCFGRFEAFWEPLHLFTEPLEIHLYFETDVLGNKLQEPVQFKLGVIDLAWKRQFLSYQAAFAYILNEQDWMHIQQVFQLPLKTKQPCTETANRNAPPLFKQLKSRMILPQSIPEISVG
jgi:hypothetical protein